MRRMLSLVVPLFLVVPVSVQAGQLKAGQTYMPGEVIVKLKNRDSGVIIGALPEDIRVLPQHQILLSRLRARYGLEEGRSIEGRGHSEPWYRLQTDRDILALCAELNKDSDVEYAQPNYIYHPCREPNDPEFPNQYAHQLIEMSKAWDITTGSRDVVIAVIGTGVDVNHPDLKANIWINRKEIPGNHLDDDKNGYVDDIHGWNFQDRNNNVTPESGGIFDFLSPDGHETNVAGVIGGVGNNGQGVAGVNWQCSLMVLRLSMAYTSTEVAAALDYAAANGARVVNMSFGGDVFGPEGDPLVKAAIDRAYAKGVLLVASAGNSYSSRPTYPASYYNVMSVASTDGEDKKTDHSSFGPWVDIAAPGTDIVTTDLKDDYIATAGTSFSSPYVAGVAGLLFAYRPKLTAMQVRAILENTTDPLQYGHVDPNMGYAGTGRVNAYQALLGADRAYPLGEIVAPGTRHTCAADSNAIPVSVFVQGDSYTLEYRPSGAGPWTKLASGAPPADPNGLVSLSLPQPGVGLYELRLRVSRGSFTHTDRTLFDVEEGSSHTPWPKPQDLRADVSFVGSPLCLDVDADGRQEIVQAGEDYSNFMSDIFGSVINIWRADGSAPAHWPVGMEMATPSSLAVGDIDGDGQYEVVAASQYEGEVYAYRVATGKRLSTKWPVSVGGFLGYIAAGPVLADLDGDGKSEILIALGMGAGLFGDTEGLLALRTDGSYLWKRRYTAQGPMSVGDFNKDGKVEIAISGTGPGLLGYTFLLDNQGQQIARWPGAGPQGTVSADLDGDGTFEVVFCTKQEVMAVRPDRTTVWKTKVADLLDTGGGLCVGDLDGDGRSEVYVTALAATDGFTVTRVYGFDYQGHLLTGVGYPKSILGDPTGTNPLIADIDGDGRRELIVAPAGEPMMAWRADGSVAPGFPRLSLAADLECSPALADLDGDGKLEIMLATDDRRFTVVDLPVPYGGDKDAWSMARHDPQNSGWAVAGPKIGSSVFPAQVKVGQELALPLTATNATSLPLHWRIGNLPAGARYDANMTTVFWKPPADEAFQNYTFALTVSDGIHLDSRTVSVAVVPDAIYSTGMDTDPNWTLDGYWSWGVPTVRAGSAKKYDPESGHTGSNAIGCALRGNYLNNIADTRYATTPAIDCRGFKNIRLSFWRWLTIEWPKDRVCLQVSTDGAAWTDLWTPDQSPLLDEAWKFVEYVVPAGLADNQPAVYFRWGLGPTNASVVYGGWTIDDVQVIGDKIAN